MSDFTPDDHIHAFFDSWNALRRLLGRIDPLNPNVDIGDVEFEKLSEILSLIQMHASAAKEALGNLREDEDAVATDRGLEATGPQRFSDCNIEELRLLSEMLFQRLLFDQMKRDTPLTSPALWRLVQAVSEAFRKKLAI